METCKLVLYFLDKILPSYLNGNFHHLSHSLVFDGQDWSFAHLRHDVKCTTLPRTTFISFILLEQSTLVDILESSRGLGDTLIRVDSVKSSGRWDRRSKLKV